MKITKKRLKEIIKEELEYTADIDQYAEPEEEEDTMLGRLGTREEQLLSRILARAVVDKYDSLNAIEAALGVEMTDDMIRYIGALKSNPMYGSSLQEDRTIDLATAQKLAAKAGVQWSGRHIILMKKYPNTPAGRKAFTAALGR